MCKIINIVVLSLGLIGFSVGQIIQSGQCSNDIQLQQNFNIDQFLGTWYEFARADHPLGGDCSTLDLTRVGQAITVYHKKVKENFFEDHHGTATVAAGTARLSLNMPQISNNPIDFWIMVTDYTNFALAYRCVNLSTTQRQLFVWQLSRGVGYPSAMIPALMNNTMINALGINSNDLREINHSEEACYILPQILPNQPVILPGQCNENITAVQNFNAGRFLGVWHEISSYYSENALGSCNRAQYSSQDGIIVDVVNSQVINQALLKIEGYATVVSNDTSGRLNVVLQIAPNVTAESELLIIATDYERWAVSYTCENLANDTRRVFSWIISRTQQLPAAAQVEVNAAVNSILDLNYAYYQPTDQSNNACFYYPDQALNEPVIFGGQCDMSIPVLQGFNAAAYLGLWHDIESYPTPFQFGTCVNAEYTLGTIGVNVRNTQVVNQTLNVINGYAYTIGTEGKLIVSFPIEGSNVTALTDYWIINTDYTSYALVYSCRNINEYQQQVTVWKLSRTRSLSAAANTAITVAMASVSVLDQRYFQPMDQSREACFFNPEPVSGQQVVFSGQCEDDNVNVVPNFNLNLFSGQWYEVEAYPKDPQPGQCISHQFSIASNTALNLVSLNVADQLLGISSSQLTFINGTEGRFNLVVDGNPNITFPYYIVATDYIDYALAYSCVNINGFFKGIFSWKLSRTKQLSNFASTSINNVMTGITVLSNDYFEPIDQTDYACFYFPDLAPGEPVILPGQCDSDIPVVTNFNAASYLGRWRLIESYPSGNQLSRSCNQATYSEGPGGTVLVYNTEVVNQTLSEINGVATASVSIGNETLGKLMVTFPGSTVPFELWILATDYTSYSLVYGCVNLNNNQRQVWSWKMSRTTNLTAESVNAIESVLSNITVLNNRYYEVIDHSDAACFYYPEPDNNSTVIFRGQCDENIQVVTNFNAVGYMGLWHDIARYPAPFQDGTCGNANYDLRITNDGPVVDVFNTQVRNQTLDTITGFAVLDLADANDTSAKLLVTFPVGGFNLTTPYWVLATDYSTYALVYSCSNIDDEYRAVSSWKLSRTKALSAAANTAINNVVNTINVLDDRYFIPQDQTREGCFYFPEPAPGVPVVFPGQCDLNITVVQNFNMSLFQGVWHEIEAYPKEEEGGQCINHQFTLSTANTLNFNSFNVIEQYLGITTGTASFSFNDNTGRMNLVFTSNGTVITIPYWIVDTDYENYALAYSCVNQVGNTDFRGVWSWKLSRTKDLSNSSRVAIDNAIVNIDVLDNVYYEPIDQSDQACFFLPDTNPGEPVIFPGQCDTNITGVANFNASRYLGLWRLVETYPTEFQLGTCGDATYSLGDNGTVAVFNTEVVNQTLSTIVGSAVLASEDGTGKLLVTFPGAPFPSEYYILDTDYDNYALVYSCFNINSDQRRVYSWKLSRTNSLSQTATNAINQVVNRIDVLNTRYYEEVDRSNSGCFYYPEPDSTRPVIFRGQCNENITVVTNFNAVGYMGLWHDIQRYPAPFQDGTCGNAFYELLITNDGPVVDVFNTQVRNQTLDTINGFAVLDHVDANDTSAKLLVTFPVGGQNLTTPYWVLATDYSTYALVYSCTNIDDEYRSVSSFKLSRTRTLSNAANIAINNIVNTIDVLDNRYYETQDQSAEGCFYFPEPELGTPVVFPGLCDLNINVVQNFSFNQFQGVWHEIEAYPKEEQAGQCISHEFSLNAANNLNLQSFNVIAESLGITSGTVTFTSNDNSARLNLAFNSNGTIISIPYWIIDTDYENYALAYSCVNQPNGLYRGVWSWKLSRAKQLSTASISAINNATQNVDILDNVYYEPISQTDESCFYYPDLSPGEPVIFPGQCDTNITAVPNFNATRYLGLWRLIETYLTEFQLGTCNDATYSLGDNGTVAVFNTEVVNQTLSTIVGSARVASVDGSGKLLVTFPNAPVESEYWILDTDYESYSLVYSCANINNNQRRVYSWKLSRTNSLPQAAIDSINQTMANVNVLDERYYESVDRSAEGCFYFPEADGSPVVFRGQCDDNITVVTNFDAVAYMGLWHDIQRYPAPFQDGTCGNAFYELLITNDGPVVDVFNTQVRNQTLDTINGFAVLDHVDANDTSAKLLVTFPVGGQNLTTPYWVLTTDYNTYALVYSCTNIDDEYRSVSSFKLSRTRTLSNAANIAINNIVNTIDVLDNRYFETQDQSAEGCFYFPEPELGTPVVFPGLCDLNVNVVQNFSFSQFQGVWHEVEAYPKEEQTGQCISHEFSLNAANNLNFQSFNVIAESLGITSGTVTFTSNDNSARLNLAFNSNGTIISIPYWIIDTDYENYALAYSCVNQPNGLYRGVWSWKLSRTKQLSTASINAINNATQNVDVLDNVYYEPISQTDESCFYYPDLGPGEAVIFPGQCDTNITAVQNFNASRYLGLWRLIETYPTEFQLGTCNDATYSLGDNGTVAVFNTEVVNQTLSTIVGSARVASVDGSGKLMVTFPDAPVESEYWILDTDYDTYSLVYSCANINSNQRRVYSWKLSRTNSLPQAAIDSINQTMTSVNVLDERYYEYVDRSAEGCFYFPEADGSPVVFRGQCDDNITVVTNFDAVAYMGTWYDIESYPAPFQGGSCGTANYALDLQTLVVSVENTQVLNQVLDVQTGTAVLATNDTSAKLLVTFEVNGINITTDYWVLATDYLNYAFVYSCQNLNDEYKQVNSFKLSRSRNLTAAAEIAIANAIDRVEVLDQKYFIEGGQTEEDCFFYPDNNGGDVLLDGQCIPDNLVQAVSNFSAVAFAGTWHEVARFPSDLQVGACSAAEYSLGAQNNIIITQTEVNNELQTANIIPGSLATDGRGVINTAIPGIPFNTFYILDTDYSEFALIYGCRNINNNTKQIYSWKLGRSRAGLSPAANDRIDNVVSNNIDLFENYFSYTDQTNDACFHYPDFEELPPSIELFGPCDESIRGVANFNAAAYLGRWIEIERYPQTDQFGTCDRAYYSLGEGNVLVRNTQVINETLAVQLGFAEVASFDNSGLLNVTFVVNGVTVLANYYILDTDYNSYALVYSCRNLPSGNRQVSSWKLSRTTSLSAQAITSMDTVISRTQGLRQQYYKPTNQTEDACFYVPELNPNAAPVFRGQCDENVNAVANFNAASFAGWWHEIERYPVDNYRGECISSQYTLGTGNTYQVVDTVVANGTGQVESSTVQVLADGRLRRIVNGQPQDTWILATDYNTYALLYSCQNVDTEYRRIWSAKHSKSRVLTLAAQNAMAPTISANRLLHPQFYQTVDQSNAACFHYPAPGQRIVIPGQCDDFIPVEQAFDVKAYEGTWYQIERYPQVYEDQTSTCIGARYTLNEATGVVTVLNWEVINGTLMTIQGNATISSSDGSAKLSVVLPVLVGPPGATVTTSLYVLTTNYESYSLAYSCSNVNSYQRSIGAWKLSRERTLSPADNTAITTYMGLREELHQPYFISVAHDVNCEELSSGAFLKSSIIVMLICALWQILS